VNIPLFKRMKKQAHRDIALLQDQVLGVVYSLDGSAVLHGGTAIWRCFRGNRFSEDLDFYSVPGSRFRELLSKEIGKSGLELLKFRETENSVYSKISGGNALVALELAKRRFRNAAVSEFETADGNFIDVFTPGPNALLLEKLSAYRGRMLVRDIYDVYHLSRFVEASRPFNKEVSGLLAGLPLPKDERNLKGLILSGAVPSFSQMADALKARFSE